MKRRSSSTGTIKNTPNKKNEELTLANAYSILKKAITAENDIEGKWRTTQINNQAEHTFETQNGKSWETQLTVRLNKIGIVNGTQHTQRLSEIRYLTSKIKNQRATEAAKTQIAASQREGDRKSVV